MKSFPYIFLFLITLSSCKQEPLNLKITHRQELTNIPSASGIVILNEDLFVICDNAPWLFRLNHKFDIEAKHPLFADFTDNIIPKSRKADLEAMTVIHHDGQPELYIFGSGSKSPERDVLLCVNLNDSSNVKQYSLTEFYHELKEISILNHTNFNIEAASSSAEHLYLFNREANLIFQFKLSQFLNYVHHSGSFPVPQQFSISLPFIKHIPARFSGASEVTKDNKIIFTASVENNLNPIDDGAILGSFVGVLDLAKIHVSNQPKCVLLSENGAGLKIKTESVAVRSQNTNGEFNVIMISDSDGGASEIIEATLNIAN